jgi:hypothetical protein
MGSMQVDQNLKKIKRNPEKPVGAGREHHSGQWAPAVQHQMLIGIKVKKLGITFKYLKTF